MRTTLQGVAGDAVAGRPRPPPTRPTIREPVLRWSDRLHGRGHPGGGAERARACSLFRAAFGKRGFMALVGGRAEVVTARIGPAGPGGGADVVPRREWSQTAGRVWLSPSRRQISPAASTPSPPTRRQDETVPAPRAAKPNLVATVQGYAPEKSALVVTRRARRRPRLGRRFYYHRPAKLAQYQVVVTSRRVGPPALDH